MMYNKQYALLKVKTDTIETLLCKAEAIREAIDRYKAEDDLDNWYAKQIANNEQELNAIHQLIDIIAK